MRTLNLTRSVSVTIDGTGAAEAQLGPSMPGEVWLPESINVSMTGTAPAGVATCTTYAGGVISPGTFVDATYQVLGAASSVIAGKTVYPGQSIFALWAGCTPGQTATLAVSGTRQVP